MSVKKKLRVFCQGVQDVKNFENVSYGDMWINRISTRLYRGRRCLLIPAQR